MIAWFDNICIDLTTFSDHDDPLQMHEATRQNSKLKYCNVLTSTYE